MQKEIRVLGLALGLAFTGCSDEADEAEAAAEAEAFANQLGEAMDEAATEAATETEGAAAEGGDLALPAVGGLMVAAPAGSSVRDAIVGEGNMVQGPGLVMTVKPAGDSDPADLEAAKEEADMYSPENIEEETLDDGWILTFTNTGGAGTNYWVMGRREVGDQTLICETTAAQEAQQAAAVTACKSIHE
jgi:hypothetical protein